VPVGVAPVLCVQLTPLGGLGGCWDSQGASGAVNWPLENCSAAPPWCGKARRACACVSEGLPYERGYQLYFVVQVTL